MQKFLKFVIYVSLAIVPFLAFYVTSVNPESWQILFPYISGKNFAFRILVEIAAAAWLMLMIINKEYRPKKSLLLYAYASFIFILLLADIFSVNPIRSFFSNFERMEGFISHIHLFLYFLILISIFKTRESWENAKTILFLSNLPVLILAWMQLLGTENIFSKYLPALKKSLHENFAPSQGGNQLDASLGNSTYLAIYCVFFIGLFFMTFVENYLKNKQYIIYLVMTILNLIILFYTGTRGAQLGLVLGIFVTSLILFFAGKRFSEIKNLRKIACGVFIFLIISYFSLLVFGQTQFAKSSPSLTKIVKLAKFLNPFTVGGKLLEIKTKLYDGQSTYQDLLTVTNDSTMTSRFLNMKMGWDGFQEKPWLGWGQDNYFYVFGQYNDARMYAQEPWFDRSHNVFFDWLIAAGILGLLAYLSLYVIAIYTMWFAKATRQHHDSYIDFLEKSLLTGLLVAYFIHNFFVFDNLISYILFFSILAYISVRFDHSDDKKENLAPIKSNIIKNIDDRVVLYGPFILVALCSAIYFLNIQYIKAGIGIISGLMPRPMADDKSSLDALNRSLDGFKLAINTGGIAKMESVEQLTIQTNKLVDEVRKANLPKTQESFPVFQLIYNYVETVKKEYTNLIDSEKNKDPRSLSIYATFLRAIGDNENSLKYGKLAYESAPLKQTIAADYMQTLLLSKNYPAVLVVAEKMYISETSHPQARPLYALALAYNGKFSEALNLDPSLKDKISEIQKEIQK